MGYPLPNLPEIPRKTLDADTVYYITNPEISAKYVFEAGGKRCFTIGAASQHRSYQTLCNTGSLPGLTKKRNFGFDFFELRVEPYEYVFHPSVIYDMTLKHENGVWHILEVWHAV